MPKINLAPKPGHHQMVLQQCELVGGYYYELPKFWPLLEVGMKLRLEREPFNSHDARAVAVYFKSHKLGFVPRKHNHVLANLMDQGAEVKAYVYAISKEMLGGSMLVGTMPGTVTLQLHLCHIRKG